MPDESLIANKREFYKSTWGHINHMLISESFFMVTWASYECPDRIIGYAAIWKGRKLIKPKGYSEHKEQLSSLSLTMPLNATELKMTISPIDLYPYDSQTQPVTINSIFWYGIWLGCMRIRKYPIAKDILPIDKYYASCVGFWYTN